ncbi:H(+) hexose cotransporter 2 [Chlorella sorokiniana]|uniref:H(+) hexose cotransporter 2 n=1 Tax=Chlorella sorokiniana TaxID=3076 RepID=A0A2P6THA3_CHLSO|nr:H(+) hexose cotransporter 2 [Chlorella sorokiniana]|eukprot:PRW33672.1 H(+) hexose cotransporter 2 [Chlorella sorokiniana]
MAGGGVVLARVSALNVADYEGRLTWYVIIVALIASAGGLLFGYDIGITGGVEAFEEFQYKASARACRKLLPGTYNDQKLQVFTSSLFLAGLFSSIFAGHITRHFGRKLTMIIGACWFLAGAGLNAVVQANQVVPLYLSEMVPFRYRGGLNMMFQLLINYGVQDWAHGWRLSLGLAAVPALVLLAGGILLPESPNSLIERGHVERGRSVLERLRGTTNVHAEFADIQEASELAGKIRLRDSWKAMFTRPYSPMLTVTCLIAMLQQWTGNVPVIFNSLGSGKSASLLNTVIIGAVNVVSTFVSILSVDKFGRRFLFLEGGIQMAAAQIVTGVVLGVEFGKHNNTLPNNVAVGVLIVICVFVAGFAWSWGPLGWLVPSEIQTLETRAAGMSAAVVINFLFSFVVGQAFLSMLCAMRWGVFIFFAGWVVLMTFFIYFFLPETKGIPVERIHARFAKHWFWSKWMGPAAAEIIERDETRTASRKAGQLEAAPAPAPPARPPPTADYEGRLTWYVIIVALIASAGGLLFGYDIGITGGVESMEPFQRMFFNDVWQATYGPNAVANNDPYCKYNDQTLQVFTSILFLAGMFSSFFAGYVTRHWGRKMTMAIGGLWFLAGAGLNAVVPLYLSEMAPFRYRGGLNMLFQLAVTIGIIVAQASVWGTNKWEEGWRLSLGLAGVPACVLLLGGILLPESPNSLIERGHLDRGRQVLQRLRGTDRVDAEFADIREASELAGQIRVRDSWRTMFTKAYSPMLIVTAMIAMLQQWTGNVPVIFSSLGSGAEGALLNTVSTFVSILSVDKFGRKFLFIEGGIQASPCCCSNQCTCLLCLLWLQMCVAQIITGVVLAVEFPKYNNVLPTNVDIGVLIVICVFVAEIQTLETRAAGMSVAVTINFLFSFVVGQCFLNMLCAMKWGVFIFFAGWVALMTVFIIFFLPETKGVPVERIHVKFAKHWFWGKWMGPAAREIIERDETRTASRKAGQLEAAPAPAPPPVHPAPQAQAVV